MKNIGLLRLTAVGESPEATAWRSSTLPSGREEAKLYSYNKTKRIQWEKSSGRPCRPAVLLSASQEATPLASDREETRLYSYNKTKSILWEK